MIIALPLHLHPGLDPGSITTGAAWTPDQVRGDEMRAIASKFTLFFGLLS